jgi:endoglucanase
MPSPSLYSRRKITASGLSLAAWLSQARPASVEQKAIDRSPDLPFLRGVNFGGLTHESWRQAPAPPAFDYYLCQKRMNVIRLNLTWEFIQPRLRMSLDPASCRVIDEQINQAVAAGAYVILEFHNFGRRLVDGVQHIIGENAACTAADFADVWARVAQRWGPNDHVILGLMNEPHDQNTEILVTVSNAAIAAIRRAGAKNLIMVSGNDWNSIAWSVGSDNQKWMLRIKDEGDNFCFDVHHYFDEWSAGQTPNVQPDSMASMLAFTAWAKTHRMKAFCGEFGCSANKRGVEACRTLLKFIEDNRDVFLGWAWWGAGGLWQPDYIFLLDPFASVTSPTNPDPSGSISWLEPVDRPQMKLLQEFLPATATPFNGWLIEVQMGPKIVIFYRKGDYLPSPTKCLLGGKACNAEWVDSGTRSISARSASGSAPTQQRDGTVEFATSKHFLEVALPPYTPVTDVYAIIRLASGRTATTRYLMAGKSAGKVQGDGIAVSPSGRLSFVDQGSSRNVVHDTARMPADQNQLVQVRLRSLKGSGAAQPQWDLESAAITSLFQLTKTFNPTKLTIGASSNRGEEGLDGRLFDLLLLNESVTIDEHARIQGRLFWDNGMAHQLPKNHPYRMRPPSTAVR